MKVCLISSNIRFENPADGVNDWPHRRTVLAQTLLAHTPDIIATQEGRFGQLEDFGILLSDYHIVDHHRSWIKERMYPTFFVKKNSWEIIKSDDLWLSETPHVAGSLSFGSPFPRLLTWMKIQPKNSDRNLLLINTHLDHMRLETREEQVKVLVNEIQKKREPQTKLIIMGDFNDSPQSKVRNIISEAFPDLIDSWKVFNSVEETSHHAFSGECQNGSRIDWILVDKDLSVEKCFLDKSHVDGRYPSDHFPVVCKIRI